MHANSVARDGWEKMSAHMRYCTAVRWVLVKTERFVKFYENPILLHFLWVHSNVNWFYGILLIWTISSPRCRHNGNSDVIFTLIMVFFRVGWGGYLLEFVQSVTGRSWSIPLGLPPPLLNCAERKIDASSPFKPLRGWANIPSQTPLKWHVRLPLPAKVSK